MSQLGSLVITAICRLGATSQVPMSTCRYYFEVVHLTPFYNKNVFKKSSHLNKSSFIKKNYTPIYHRLSSQRRTRDFNY